MLAERARRGLHHFIGVGAALQRVGVGNQGDAARRAVPGAITRVSSWPTGPSDKSALVAV